MKVGDKVVPIRKDFRNTPSRKPLTKPLTITYLDSSYIMDKKFHSNWYFPTLEFCLESEVDTIRKKIEDNKSKVKIGDYIKYKGHTYNVTDNKNTQVCGTSRITDNNYLGIWWQEIDKILTKAEIKKEIADLKAKNLLDSNKVKEEINRLIPKRKSLLTRDLTHIMPNFHTNDIFIEHIQKGTKKNGYFSVCCAHTKTTDDLHVYIPDTTLKLLGYNKLDLTIWLKFLEEADIDFQYEYLGVVNCGDSQFAYKDYFKKSNQYYSKKKNHLVLIKGDKNNYMNTYFRFILLRYLFETTYHTIPAVAIQLKRALKDKVTHLQAICLAHYNASYSSGHALAAQPNPFIEYKNALLDLTRTSMNSTFVSGWKNPGMSTGTIIQRFKEKKFTEILEYFNKLYERTKTVNK